MGEDIPRFFYVWPQSFGDAFVTLKSWAKVIDRRRSIGWGVFISNNAFILLAWTLECFSASIFFQKVDGFFVYGFIDWILIRVFLIRLHVARLNTGLGKSSLSYKDVRNRSKFLDHSKRSLENLDKVCCGNFMPRGCVFTL